MTTEQHPTQGCDRCECGCKYWEDDLCIDCGRPFAEPIDSEVFTIIVSSNHRCIDEIAKNVADSARSQLDCLHNIYASVIVLNKDGCVSSWEKNVDPIVDAWDRAQKLAKNGDVLSAIKTLVSPPGFPDRTPDEKTLSLIMNFIDSQEDNQEETKIDAGDEMVANIVSFLS